MCLVPRLQKLDKRFFFSRFTNENVVVTAPSKVKAGSDLQLPSMAALVSKTSSQAFFLRILKVIVQIREAVRLANTKKTGNDTRHHCNSTVVPEISSFVVYVKFTITSKS